MDLKISVNDDTIDVVTKITQSNFGALMVINQFIELYPKSVLAKIIILEELNLHGPEIWIGYKDYCGQDINKFIECLDKRDMEMMAMIKKEMGQNG